MGEAATKRADYASTRDRAIGAFVERVEEGSPAWEVGIESGMRIDSVNGVPLTDLIAWRWEADGPVAVLEVVEEPGEGEGDPVEVELVREPGQDWGIEFTDVLFDGIRTCVNACKFCFMAMLPEDARASLMIRDDDYRLSFLQGNFVTLTNMTDEDVDRVIECRLEPMNVSLHAISPDVRRNLIGRHAARGIEVLERLLEAGIEVHGQIVLCPGLNDGEELVRTLDWVEAHPGITSLALVPVGYTQYSKNLTRSFWDDPEGAREVVGLVGPYQERSRARDGMTRFQLSDEFYVAANMDVPPADSYDGYPQFYDGIGMLRSFLDETSQVIEARCIEMARAMRALGERDLRVLVVCGEAAERTIGDLTSRWCALCGGDCPHVITWPIRNDYFGGDVNVTGLIVAQDLLAQLPQDLTDTLVLLPEVMFNFDGITLDGVPQADIVMEIVARGGIAHVNMPSPGDIVDAVARAIGLAAHTMNGGHLTHIG
ncbi:MAG: DUF512 domain-containing protein [Atopobiaceae bacterium]|nr:DUF512 domain-containing protein [Atopobiaceae bacterium]